MRSKTRRLEHGSLREIRILLRNLFSDNRPSVCYNNYRRMHDIPMYRRVNIRRARGKEDA